MKATAQPVTRMKATAYPWQGPLSPVALRLVSGNVYELVDALGRTVTPSTTPAIRINGGQEHGLAISETTRTNAVPHDCPTRSQLSHVAGDSPADAAMASPVLRIASGWESGVVLSSAARTQYASKKISLGSGKGASVNGEWAVFPAVHGSEDAIWSVPGDLTPTATPGVVSIIVSIAGGPPKIGNSSDCDFFFVWRNLWVCTTTTDIVQVGTDLYRVTKSGMSYAGGNRSAGAGIVRTRTMRAREFSICNLEMELGATAGAYIEPNGYARTLTDYTIGAFAPDGSLPVTLAQPADSLAWDNAPAGCALVKTDSTHYALTQPAVSDGNLIGYPALTFSGDLTLGRSAWQDATVTSGQTYTFSAIVEVEGEPTYGPDGLFRVVLSGDTPSIGTATWTAIPGQTNRYRLDVTGLSVASSTGRVGIYRAPGQADARPFTISRWTLCDHPGRLIAGGASEADFVRDGSSVTLTRALGDGLEAVWE